MYVYMYMYIYVYIPHGSLPLSSLPHGARASLGASHSGACDVTRTRKRATDVETLGASHSSHGALPASRVPTSVYLY